jgi:hypothetical protein|tara:strand:- start:113402 stop:113851 length:450 start_codon:yes stop_codon:yes gene_type:complete
MVRVNYKLEIAVALLLLALGLAIAWTGAGYGVGTLRRLGPGLLPLWLGAALAGLSGLALFGAVLSRRGDVALDVRGMVWLSVGFNGFALLLETTGLLPAALLIVLCVGVGNRDVKPLRDLGTAVGLSLFGYLLFYQLLGIPISFVNGLG